jgi:hypothetical protein
MTRCCWFTRKKARKIPGGGRNSPAGWNKCGFCLPNPDYCGNDDEAGAKRASFNNPVLSEGGFSPFSIQLQVLSDLFRLRL